MSAAPELVLDAHALNGEGPLWSVAERKLYWIDIEEPALHRFDPIAATDERWIMPSEIGAFALCRSGGVIAALRTGFVRLDLDRGASTLLAPPPYEPLTHRFNAGKCDAKGRFWVATMVEPLDGRTPDARTPPSPLCVFEGGALREAGAAAVIGNGLGWSPDGARFWFADSFARTVRRFAFDAGAGAISDPQPFARFTAEQGRPDGAAVDVEGCYWTALYDGGRVVRLRPDGGLDREIRLPVSEPTMCAFGGPDLQDLYITTASSGLAPETHAKEPQAGALFRCRAPAPGLPPNLFEG